MYTIPLAYGLAIMQWIGIYLLPFSLQRINTAEVFLPASGHFKLATVTLPKHMCTLGS